MRFIVHRLTNRTGTSGIVALFLKTQLLGTSCGIPWTGNGRSELPKVWSSYGHYTCSYVVDFENCRSLDLDTQVPPEFKDDVYDDVLGGAFRGAGADQTAF